MKSLRILASCLLMLGWSGLGEAAYVDELRGEIFPGELNVRDFGAVGDGVHDDTAALTAAARAAEQHDYTLRAGSCEDDGPHQQLVFPSGTYRITDTVFFKRVAHLRALGAVTIVQCAPTKDAFYFHNANRVRVEGFTFRGGRHQLNMATLNREASNFLVRGCTFLHSTDYAIKSIGRMVAEGYDSVYVDLGFDVGEFMPDEAGVFHYDPRYIRGQGHNNSTFILYEDCTFDGCAHAVNCHSDGTIMRNCRVCQPAIAGCVFNLKQNFHFYNVEVTVERDPAVSQCVFSFSGVVTAAIEDCSFKTTNKSGVCLIRSRAYTASYMSLLILRRCQIESGGCPEGAIVHFDASRYISLVAMDEITETSGRSVKAIGFEAGEPTEETLYASNEHFQSCGNDCGFGFAFGTISANVITTGNAVFNRYRIQYPTDIPTPPIARSTTRARRGKLLRAVDYGVDDKTATDDTAAMERFAAALAAEPDSIGVLPCAWIRLSRPVTLSGDCELVGAGTAGFVHADSATGFFRVANGAQVTLKNLFFQDGKHVVEYGEKTALPTEIVVENCYAYNSVAYDKFDGAAYAISAEENPECVHFVLTKGCHYQPILYRGNARAHLDGFWWRTWPWVPSSEPMSEGCGLVNEKGGVLRMTDLLGVPCTLRRWSKSGSNDRSLSVGDYRWVDNYGEVFSDFVRYGGEYGGLVVSYNYAGAKIYVEGGFSEYKATSCVQTPVLCAEAAVDVRFFATICISQDIRHPVKPLWREGPGEALQATTGSRFNLVYPLPSPDDREDRLQ